MRFSSEHGTAKTRLNGTEDRKRRSHHSNGAQTALIYTFTSRNTRKTDSRRASAESLDQGLNQTVYIRQTIPWVHGLNTACCSTIRRLRLSSCSRVQREPK